MYHRITCCNNYRQVRIWYIWEIVPETSLMDLIWKKQHLAIQNVSEAHMQGILRR